jgi:hypothetical protein
MYKLEYYVLVEWYHRHIRRFLFVTDKPFSLSWAEGCALWRVMGVHGWNSHREAMHGREAMRRDAMHRISTATAILWQIDKYFAINN